MALRVVGAGVGRTGTNSLKLALEQVGFGPCHHMFELVNNPELQPPWEAVVEGAAPDWDAMFEGFAAQVDWPGAAFWQEIAAHYSEAKVILSVRDPESWAASMHKTILPFIARGGNPDIPHSEGRARMARRFVHDWFLDGRGTDTATLIEAFEAHAARVRATIAPERLLVFDVREGWEPLCAFLGVPVPDTPFPRTNDSAAFNAPNR